MSRSRSSAVAGPFVIASVGTLALAASAFAGPIWDADLTDDAKQTPDGAQVITADGTVAQIRGKLNGTAFQADSDFIDMYLVKVVTPSILKFSTINGDGGAFAEFDSQLFIFRAVQTTQGNLVAQAVFANNDAASGVTGSFIGNSANDGSQFTITQTGLYFIAISNTSATAQNANGGPLWEGLNIPGRVPFGNLQPFFNWGGQQGGGAGNYTIRVEGIAGVPAPGAVALLGLAGLVGNRRRR